MFAFLAIYTTSRYKQCHLPTLTLWMLYTYPCILASNICLCFVLDFIPMIFFVPRFVALTLSAYQQFHRSHTESSDVSSQPLRKATDSMQTLTSTLLNLALMCNSYCVPLPFLCAILSGGCQRRNGARFFLDQRLIFRWNLQFLDVFSKGVIRARWPKYSDTI